MTKTKVNKDLVKVNKTKEMKKEVNSISLKTADCKLFGSLINIKAKGNEQGMGVQSIGAVRVENAYSLHPIEIEEYQITSTFKHSEDSNGGSIGDKSYVPYGLYSFQAMYNANQGKNNNVDSKLLYKLDKSFIHGAESYKTGTKNVQTMLYIRVLKEKANYNMLSDRIKTSYEDEIKRIGDVDLDLGELVEAIKKLSDVKEVRLYVKEGMEYFYPQLSELKDKLSANDIDEWKEDDNEYHSEYIAIYQVINSNPNGDPSNANLPRTIELNDEEYGMISPERIKRWSRDYLEDFENEIIFISRKEDLQTSEQRYLQLKELI